MVGMLVGDGRVATAAVGCKEKVAFGINVSPFSVPLQKLFAKAASELVSMVCRLWRVGLAYETL